MEKIKDLFTNTNNFVDKEVTIVGGHGVENGPAAAWCGAVFLMLTVVSMLRQDVHL